MSRLSHHKMTNKERPICLEAGSQSHPVEGAPGRDTLGCARDWWPGKVPRMSSAPQASVSSAVKSEVLAGVGGDGHWGNRKAKLSGRPQLTRTDPPPRINGGWGGGGDLNTQR